MSIVNDDRQERDSCCWDQAQTAKTNIRYPYALDVDCQVVNIYDAPKGQPYLCLACSAPMLVKRGDIRQPHFAHKHSIPCTDPNTALHKTAQALIIQSLDNARNSQEEYRLGFPCPDCGDKISYNIAPAVTHVEREESIVEGTRSDIVLYRDGRDPIIVEVVVTHDVEPGTRQRYAESKIPVFLIRPTWDSLDELKLSVIADSTLNLQAKPCSACIEREERRRRQQEEKRRKEETARRQFDSELTRMDRREHSNPSSLPFQPWIYDYLGRQMYPHVRRRVYANAIILTEMGFRQSKKNSHVFWYRLSDGCCVFAQFDFLVRPIWEDTRALIDCDVKGYSDELGSFLIETVAVKCRKAGVGVMASLEEDHTDQQEIPLSNNAVKLVNKEVLNNLLADRIYNDTEQQPAQSQEKPKDTQHAEMVREPTELAVQRHFQQVEKARRRRAEQEEQAEVIQKKCHP